MKPIVIVESPYAGDIEKNLKYVRAAMRDCILRGEAPFASHALYTQPGVLRDEVKEERDLGIEAGFAFRPAASKTVVYTDLGMSSGMAMGINDAIKLGQEVEYRSLPEWKVVNTKLESLAKLLAEQPKAVKPVTTPYTYCVDVGLSDS